MNFAPLHNHTEYSALDGLSTCREVAERCQCIGCSSVGITDHATVAGHLEFGKTMQEYGIKPIYGCELYHGVKTEFGKNERDQAHFVAGAMTDEGLRNLWRLVDAASSNFRFVGRVNWEMLDKYKEGVFATSACIQGLVSKSIINEDRLDHLNQYLEIYGENFYIELHTYPGEEHERLNLELVSVARERGVPLVYATDAHFASPEQYEIHDAYVAMQTGENILMPKDSRKMWHPKALYIMGEDEIREALSYLPDDAVDEALENTGLIADKVNAELPEIKRHLPAFIPADSPWVEDREMTAAELFMSKVEEGLTVRYPDAGQEVFDRAATEIEVFLEAGLEHYFLQAWDFVQYCEKEGIRRGPGRGSAAGSIVAYALGITDIDPLEHDLIFERFYNAGREKGFPDIDSDFPTRSREKVKKYMEDRWGQDKVRSIGTITRLKPKSAIDRTYKCCGITFDAAASLKKIVQEVPDIEILGPDSIGWDEEIDPGKTIYVMEHVGKEINEWIATFNEDERKRIERWLSVVRMVCSRISGYGIHPSGVVVSDVELADELPCMWNNSKKTQVTCFPMNDVDSRMFVKQDFLGLANLDVLDEWEAQVVPLVGEIDWKGAEKDYDHAMWGLLDKGLSLGVFQIEDGYARHLCKEIKPRSIADLGIIVALNRPGPIRSGAPDSFIARRNGEEDDKFDGRNIPLLAEILDDTYGWFLYQEQVIAYFSALGYDLSDADAVRKILGKKKPEEMAALHNGKGEWIGKGYVEMAGKAGLSVPLAAEIWEVIEDFAKYSFNKSHAIAYATVAFRTLYAKFNSPRHFFIACIRVANHQKKDAEEVGKYVGEARRMSIEILPPDIEYSETDIAIGHDDHVYYGFANVKGIGKGAGDFICRLREKYAVQSPEDLSAAIEAEQADWEAERDAAKAEGATFKKKSPRQTLPANRIPPLFDAGGFDRFEDRALALRDKQKLEKETLGVILSDNCEEVFAENWEAVEDCDSYIDLEMSDSEKVYIPGIVSIVVPRKTRKDGKAMGIVTIEYQGDQAEFVVFPQDWKNYKFLWKERTPAIFALSKGDRGIRFEKAIQLK